MYLDPRTSLSIQKPYPGQRSHVPVLPRKVSKQEMLGDGHERQ